MQWSSTYKVEGIATKIFKMQVLIVAFTDDKGVEHEEFFKWYVVVEDNFRDFSGVEWREDNLLNPNDDVCTNIDDELLKKWSIPNQNVLMVIGSSLGWVVVMVQEMSQPVQTKV